MTRHGRNALVTGSSYGIGAATAERLVDQGVNVVLTGRTRTRDDRGKYNPVSLEETAERLSGRGPTVGIVAADLADEEARLGIVPQAVEILGGPVDILVNNAAAGVYGPMGTYSLKRRRLMFEINLHAPIDLAQQVLPAMVERGEGWIVNVTSGVARYRYGPPEGPPGPVGFGTNQAIYGASKAALNRVTVTWAEELYGSGVRMNAIEPRGVVLSDGAVARGMDMIPESAVQPMESMVDGVVWLCECPADHTGGIHNQVPD